MPKGVYKKSRAHIDKMVGNLKPGYGKGMKFPERQNEKSHLWLGDRVGYSGIHRWLRSRFGNPEFCEHCMEPGKKVGRRWNIQWALIKGEKYRRVRENFFGLCAKCHHVYDDLGFNEGHKIGVANTHRRIDLSGQRFGKLIVVGVVSKNKWGNLKFLCKCDCGGEKAIPSANLRSGRTKSCGCMSSRNFMIGNQINKGRTPWNKKK